MPRRVERAMTSLILATSPRKIRSWISGELSMISIAAMRPVPASRGISRCEISARMLSDRSISSCSRRSSGKKLMMRSSAWLELLACSVASTRWPVSANWMPYSMVSRSRISPIRITSGAWRRVFLSAACQESVSTPDFAVRDHAALVLVHVLDRVLDRDDVAAGLLVAVADHRRQRGRLARAGAADQDHQAALGQHDLLEDRAAGRVLRTSGSWR